jgi:CBS domain-containing protein
MFGGVAKMQRDTDSPGVEFRVAIAGPLVTLAIVGLCLGAGALATSAHDVWSTSRFQETTTDEPTAVFGYLAFINAVVLVFNLIPGFPLDGGRIARALAWWRTGDRNRATRFAARLGRGFAILMIGAGAYMFVRGDIVGGVWLAFIGIFLSQAARGAEVESTIGSRIEGMTVSDVMDAEPVAVPEDLPLDRAENEFFLRYRWPWFPVVDDAGRLVGLLSQEAVAGVPEAVRPGRPVGSAMARDEDGSGLRVRIEDPLEALLGREALGRLGALMAVDGEGRLRGIVTVDRLRRALRPAAPVA